MIDIRRVPDPWRTFDATDPGFSVGGRRPVHRDDARGPFSGRAAAWSSRRAPPPKPTGARRAGPPGRFCGGPRSRAREARPGGSATPRASRSAAPGGAGVWPRDEVPSGRTGRVRHGRPRRRRSTVFRPVDRRRRRDPRARETGRADAGYAGPTRANGENPDMTAATACRPAPCIRWRDRAGRRWFSRASSRWACRHAREERPGSHRRNRRVPAGRSLVPVSRMGPAYGGNPECPAQPKDRRASSAREATPSLAKTLRRWKSMVRGLRNI